MQKNLHAVTKTLNGLAGRIIFSRLKQPTAQQQRLGIRSVSSLSDSIRRHVSFTKNPNQSLLNETRLHSTKDAYPLSYSILNDYALQLSAPDIKSDCGIFACAYADQLQSPILVPDMLRCPVDYLKARYHTTDGGGDGGGIIVQSSPDVLANFYGCDERFFKGEGRLVQVSFSRDEHVRSGQEFELKSRLNELGATIIVQKHLKLILIVYAMEKIMRKTVKANWFILLLKSRREYQMNYLIKNVCN